MEQRLKSPHEGVDGKIFEGDLFLLEQCFFKFDLMLSGLAYMTMSKIHKGNAWVE
jgi:hypothetical protein